MSVINNILLKKTTRIFLAKTPSSQRKAISFGFKNQALKISFASFAALREMPFASAFGSGLSGLGFYNSGSLRASMPTCHFSPCTSQTFPVYYQK
jgi:hypothetical protein